MTYFSEVKIIDDNNEKANVTHAGLDVNIQDQHTPIIIAPLNKVNNTTTITVAAAVDDTSFTVSSTTGFVDGAFVTLTSISDNRYYIARQLGAPVGNVITVDTPIDFAFPIGAQATAGVWQMNVNGSVTHQTFSLRASDPGIPVVIDITRIIIYCLTAGAVSLAKFGDIVGGLTNGLVLRKVDGITSNIFNVKTNGELSSMVYDFTPYLSTNPAQGQDGFVARMTFAGQSKMGVVIRLEPGDDLEAIVQDDLSSLESLIIMVEGHVVES